MSYSARLILRIVMATVTVICVGAIGVLGFTVIEPFYQAFGEPPAALDWGTPASTTITFASVALLALLLVLVIWFVTAPIRHDRRQQFRR